MFQAINDNVILKRSSAKVTESGIITMQEANTTPLFEVVATTEQTKDLQGKEVYAQKAVELSEKDDFKYYSCSYKDILAVVS